jgi:hypothetical protein
VYFLKADALPMARRIMASAHGSLFALLYAGALVLNGLGLSTETLAVSFWAAFILPLASMALALAWVKGRGVLHLLLLALLVAAAWLLFIGTMAVTGAWL